VGACGCAGGLAALGCAVVGEAPPRPPPLPHARGRRWWVLSWGRCPGWRGGAPFLPEARPAPDRLRGPGRRCRCRGGRPGGRPRGTGRSQEWERGRPGRAGHRRRASAGADRGWCPV